MKDERKIRLINFLKEIEKLKTVKRQTYCSEATRKESDAEHCWHLAMFLVLIEKDLPEMDFLRAIKIALIHDIAEIYSGDPFCFDENKRKNKNIREYKAAKKLFAMLPSDMENEFMELFKEYEEMKTPEARIVKAIDKVQPVLQNLCSEGKSWKEHKISYDDIDNYKRKFVSENKVVLEIYEDLLNEGKEKGWI